MSRTPRRRLASLDVFWLREESLEDGENLPPLEVLAAEIVEDLEAALAQFAEVAETISAPPGVTSDPA